MGRLPPPDQEVQEVSDVLREEAIVLAFGGSRMRAQRVLERPRDPAREAVLVLRDGKGHLQQAAVLSRAPGRTALLTMSPLRGTPDRARGALLVREAIVTAQRMDVAVVQALVEPLAKDDLAAMELGGMHVIATLAYLERPSVRECRPLPPAHAEIRISPWDGRQRDMLESLLSKTYVDSLDCPGLAEMRSTRDILDGHLATGVLDSRLWLLLEWRGETVGACFISEIPSSRCMELVYFGLIPRARGIGLGRVLLDHALVLLRNDLRGPIALACDERNTPAMRLYASRGFAPRLRRAALVCKVAEPHEPPR
ncbi:MAG: GNAT family N-acetyltransferase [Planctomycetota bacterium]